MGGRAMGRSYNYTYQNEGKKICCDFEWQKLSGFAKRFQFKSVGGVKNDTTHRSVKDAFALRAGWKMRWIEMRTNYCREYIPRQISNRLLSSLINDSLNTKKWVKPKRALMFKQFFPTTGCDDSFLFSLIFFGASPFNYQNSRFIFHGLTNSAPN